MEIGSNGVALRHAYPSNALQSRGQHASKAMGRELADKAAHCAAHAAASTRAVQASSASLATDVLPTLQCNAAPLAAGKPSSTESR